MVKKIFVGNIPWKASEDDIRSLFAQYGNVHSVTFINDRATQKFRGFGFVEMDLDDAKKAIRELHATNFHGRYIRVKEARDKRQQREPSQYYWNY